MTYQLTASSADRLIDLVTAGQSVEDAAAALGTSGRTIYRRAKVDEVLRLSLSAAIAQREAARPRLGHGRPAMYSHGCRCQPCREAHRAQAQRLRHRRRGHPVPSFVEHGKATTYGNWSCRCEPCSAAHRVACQRRAAARAGRAA